MNKKGFTLLEVIVVTLIVGILAAVGIPAYKKGIETNQAVNAVSLLQAAGTANRMYYLKHGSYQSGYMTSSCNTAASCGTDTAPCNLISCKYLAPQDFDNNLYALPIFDGTSRAEHCAGGITVAGGTTDNWVAIVCRNTASATYTAWGYGMNTNGGITALGSAPAATQ
jgi:prepilin-type N-terminal cleavage/methylation domain-containing protein